MPGILGFISRSQTPQQPSVIEPMLKTMLHERTYTSGTLTIDQVGLSAGWVCHGGSYSDCMPIWNETRDICLLFAGENYFADGDVNLLRTRGHRFDPHKANSLVYLYEETGDDFFPRLNGVFSGVLVDLRRKEIVLFNDRYGLGRVYYHETQDGFYFASEAKALLRVIPQLRNVDLKSLAEYFACGSVLQDRTLFSGISLLPPGSAWMFKPAEPARKRPYFDRGTWETQTSLPREEYYLKLKETFARILPRYLGGEDRVAMSLTGGLDSRLIMAWINGYSSKLHCYSHRGMFNECIDARLGRKVAAECGRPHRLVRVGEEFFSQFQNLALSTVYRTDGVMEVIGSAGFYANRIAMEIAPVRMTGNYGGEILRALVMLSPAKLRNPYFAPDFKPLIADGVETLTQERRVPRTSFVAFKQVPWHHYSRFALENSLWTIRSPYLDNDLVSLAYQAPNDVRVNQGLAERLIADGNPALAAFPTDRGPLGRSGVFGRITELYQEFTFKADYAFDYGMPQWLANIDRVLRPLHFERWFLGRHKYVHFRYWYRHQLAPFVKDVLLDSRSLTRPYLDRNAVEKMVDAHVSGHGNYTLEITALLTTELMQRQLIENISPV